MLIDYKQHSPLCIIFRTFSFKIENGNCYENMLLTTVDYDDDDSVDVGDNSDHYWPEKMKKVET